MPFASLAAGRKHPGFHATVMWLFWHFVLDFGIEKYCALAALGWGCWVTVFRPLANLPGWHYLLWAVAWQSVRADLIWGPLLVTLGAFQLIFAMRTYADFPRRGNIALFMGALFANFALALFLQEPGSTGVPVYGLIAWGNFAASYQMAVRERGRRFYA